MGTYGVELRPAIVQEVEGIARRLGPSFDGLTFGEGAIASLLPIPQPNERPPASSDGGAVAAGRLAGEGAKEVAAAEASGAEGTVRGRVKGGVRLEEQELDVLIALHACDTATDDALWYAFPSLCTTIP